MRPRLWIVLAMSLSFGLGMMVEAVSGKTENAAPAKATGVGGVFFKAREPRKLADWYKEHLGINLVPAGTSANAPSFANFEWTEKDDPKRAGSTVFAIFSDKSKYFDPSTASFMIDFRVTNLDSLLEQLKKDGVTVDTKVENESNGRFGWAIDGEGNRIELWEPSPKMTTGLR